MVLFRRAPKLKAPGFFIPNLRHRISPAAAPIATPSRLASEVKMPGVLLNGHQNGAGAATDEPRNVLGSALQLFSRSPLTGFYRDGFCRAGAADMGNHSVAGIVSEEFLDYTAAQGNDLRVVGLSEGCKCVFGPVRFRCPESRANLRFSIDGVYVLVDGRRRWKLSAPAQSAEMPYRSMWLTSWMPMSIGSRLEYPFAN